MKIRPLLKNKLLISLVLCGLYVGWIMIPHIKTPKVINTAKISSDEVEMVQELFIQCESFAGKGEFSTILSSFFKPWTRPIYFIEITSKRDEIIYIKVGYSRGDLFGGGRYLSIKKNGDKMILDPPKQSGMWIQ